MNDKLSFGDLLRDYKDLFGANTLKTVSADKAYIKN
jgi:hypothetical protein